MNPTLVGLYDYARKQNIEIISLATRKAECMSMMDEDGSCGIAVNPFLLKSESDEKVKLAHELGHCETGAFYNIFSKVDVRTKHERTADKWAIKKLIPEDELKEACKFCANRWELSEYFGVTEDFMQKAMDYYSELIA